MMIVSDNIDELYKKAIQHILNNGADVTARGLNFRECVFQHLILTNPRARLIQNPERKLSKKFAMAEFIWIMTGKNSLEQIGFYNKKMGLFSDDNETLNGAYGLRLRHWRSGIKNGFDQIQNCLERLQKDLYTRQAVMLILDPDMDFSKTTKDVPCNNYIQFLYRNNKLHLMVYVRSNDLNLGFPYDAFHWTLLQELFASNLGVEVGEYHHIVGSLHIYDQDIEKMKKIIQTDVKHDIMIPMINYQNMLGVFEKLDNFESQYRLENVINISLFKDNPWWIPLLIWITQ